VHDAIRMQLEVHRRIQEQLEVRKFFFKKKREERMTEGNERKFPRIKINLLFSFPWNSD